MNPDRIQRSLQTLFEDDRRWAHQGRRLVFWYDADAAFTDLARDLQLDVARVVAQGSTPFALKRHLLLEDPHTNILLYAPFAEPPEAENWLLDLQCSGLMFSADRAALIFSDLGFLHRPLERFIRDMQLNDRHVILCGVQSELLQSLTAYGLIDLLGKDNVFATGEGVFVSVKLAIERARKLLGGSIDAVGIDVDDDELTYEI